MNPLPDQSGNPQPAAGLRVAITAADVALLTIMQEQLHVLLMPVDLPPHYPHMFGLPGGILHAEETAREAAARNLLLKASVSGVYMEQLHAYSDPARDLRSRSVSIAYLALIPGEDAAALDIGTCQWWPISTLPKLAFDHEQMIKDAAARLAVRLQITTLASHLLPRQFTLAQLQTVHEIVLGKPMDKRNFRKKITEMAVLKSAGTYRGAAGRPAELFEFE